MRTRRSQFTDSEQRYSSAVAECWSVFLFVAVRSVTCSADEILAD
jgi:hypothetical protein